MNWQELNKKAVILLIQGKVRKVMESKNFGVQYEVGDEDEYYNVEIITKKGHNLMNCNCKGCVTSKDSPICAHKIAVILMSLRDEGFK